MAKTVNKSAKNHPNAESVSVSEAAARLGVSIPTLKRMEAEGGIEGFRTPGGHLRIHADSLEAVRERGTRRTRSVREASHVLQNRRERLEELTLEAQEVRARRELDRLRREDEEETERAEAEEMAREEEEAEREAELEAARERQDHEMARRRARREAERAQAAFRAHWMQEANQLLLKASGRLSASQRKEIMDAIEREIAKRQPSDAPWMQTVIVQTFAVIIERYIDERRAQERCEGAVRSALWGLSAFATEQEKARATAAAREAIRRAGPDASEGELQTAVEAAVRPIRLGCERRLLDERVLSWAVSHLPWNKSDLDAARLKRECTAILTELPEDVSEAEAKEALSAATQEACRAIEEQQARGHRETEQRRAEEQRKARKAQLVAQGVSHVFSYLIDLKQADEITAEECWDFEFRQHLDTVTRRTLEAELTGDESDKELREFVEEIITAEL